ncbi:MAG: AI-2E family transporter [Elusimicrobiota bacterium]|jgi:predicted PurR-regulated permease PerM|nr:AI-2E family transporter [Elusimicrobiota bacterium]
MTEGAKSGVFFVGVLGLLVVGIFFYAVRDILPLFLIAAFLTYLLFPLVSFFQSFGFRRWVAATAAMFSLLVIIVAAITIFGPKLLQEIEHLAERIPTYYQHIKQLTVYLTKIKDIVPSLRDIEFGVLIKEETMPMISNALKMAPTYIREAFSILSMIILSPMIMFFMLLGGGKWIDIIVKISPANFIETVLSIVYEINSLLGNYLRAQLIEIAFIGISVTVVLGSLGLHFAAIIGICAGVLNFIPYLGSITGLTLACVFGIIQFNSPVIILKIVPAFLLIQFVDNHVVQPLVMSTNMNLSPTTIIFAVLAGGTAFGFVGMVFAVPAMAIAKLIFFVFVRHFKNSDIF